MCNTEGLWPACCEQLSVLYTSLVQLSDAHASSHLIVGDVAGMMEHAYC